MNNPLNLNINLDWNEIPSDGSKCEVCNQLIIGKMFQRVIFVDFEPAEISQKICTECYALKDDDPKGEK